MKKTIELVKSGLLGVSALLGEWIANDMFPYSFAPNYTPHLLTIIIVVGLSNLLLMRVNLK